MTLQDNLIDTIDQQAWLEPTSESVQRAVTGVLNPTSPVGRRINDFLNGTWLGHPLHPVLTDVPLGAWTVTVLLDAWELATGRADLAPGADAAVVIGLAGAFGSAVTGLADWQHTVDKPRRIGLLHALLNTSAVVLYSTSWLLRRGGARRSGQTTALLGYSVVALAAYLGGDLVYKDRITVNHAPEATPPATYTPVAQESDVPEGTLRAAQAGEVKVVLTRQNGIVFALADTCSHLGGPLSEGTLVDGAVICPWHGSCFALADGRIINGPATCAQPHYDARIHNGQIEVRNPPNQQ